MKDTFLLIDGNSLMHRAFHALPLMGYGGVYTNAIHGFLTMLLKVVREEDVRYCAVCFDEHGPTFRHVAYADYKAGRTPTPPELVSQFKLIRELLPQLGIRQYSLQGYEADDLLGTLSLQGEGLGVKPLLLTGDRDALQLVDGVTELMFTRKGITDTIRFTPETVRETYGFGPEQVTDWKGMAGDSSDNIPGIPGVGDKTAVRLLQKYGTLENTLAHAAEEKGKLGEKLQTYADQARSCKELARIHRDAPVELHLEECTLDGLKQGVPALEKLQLRKVAAMIAGKDAPAGTPAQTVSTTPAPAAQTAQAPQQEEADAPLSPLPYPPLTELAGLPAWESFLQALTPAAYPLALCLEGDCTLATTDGQCCRLALGGDLLSPGVDPAEALRALAPALLAGPVVVHDGKKLLHTLRRHGLPLPESFHWDTMLGAYVLNPQEKSYALGALLGGLPADARGLMSLFRWQEERTRRDGVEKLLKEVELPLSHVLFRMEEAGFTVDGDALRALGQGYTAEIEACREQVYQAAGVRDFNLNSTQQLGEVLFDRLQLPHGKKTQKGYSTSAEVLEKLRDIGPEIIDPLLRYRQLTKLNGTYIEGLLRLMGPEGRIHSTFDQVATATGRISSSEPNLQNIPVRTAQGREIRRAFVPRKGWVLLDADYSQIELRLMAHFSGDKALVEAFRTGQDVHARTASEIFDVPLSEVTPTLRSRAKAVNFGLIYGISGFGLARNTGVTQKEAKEFIARYFAKYPGVKRFMDEAVRLGQERGYAETLLGRRRYLPELASSRNVIREFGRRAAMNTPVQGTAADIIKLAMVRVDEALRREKMQATLILQVHDELLIECPPEEAERAAALLRTCMEQVMTLSVPLAAEVHQGANWYETK